MQLFETLSCNFVILPAILEHPPGGDDGDDDDDDDDNRMQDMAMAKANTPNQKGTRTGNADVNTCQNCGRT